MRNIIAENVFNSTISASSENPVYPFSDALTDYTLSRVGRTVTTSDQWFKFSFDNAVNVDTVAIFESNFNTSATVKIQANATDVWTSPSIDISMTFTKDNRRSNIVGKDVGVWSHQFTSTESYQYWRVSVTDASNTDGYLELGFVFLDENYDFPGMSVNQTFSRETTSDPEFNESRQIFGLKRTQYNGASFNFPFITESEKTSIDTFYDKTDTVTPFCMLVWEDNLDVQRPLYVVNSNLTEWRRVETNGGVGWTTQMEIEEVF